MQEKLNIIIIGTAYPFRGGLAAFNERLAIQLQNDGHKVTIFTFNLQYPGFLFPGKSQYSSEKAPANLIIKQKINSVNPFNWIKVGKEIKKEAPDLIIFCYWMAFMAPCFGTIARIAKSDKCKTLALIHNMIPHEPSILDKLFPAYFVNSMDGFVAMAESVKSDINHFDKLNKPKVVSPHPIYDHYGAAITKKEAILKLGLSEESAYILFFGFIRAYKGLDLLLRAFADERLRKFKIKLIIAGEFYEDSKPYLDLIEQLHLSNCIELKTNFIPDDEVRNYFCAADIVVQPYKNATQSGVTQICYHFNKPMMVTNVGGLAEIVPDGISGYVVAPDPKAIADKLVDFYENNKIDNFTEGIIKEKQKYLWSKMTASIIELYSNLIK